ncbi:DNA mismatch repair protein Msh6-like isoform X2 [Mercenaria mercenaria]|uniref:DNA mismatch repair protein Msh6-like isoform X2 n=1 Tax=Mercenaria mercenaria TaxID=6596 RepID=UPI00234F6DA9|nr:DNA mismatch repair protein Msh6-like isoform X2 [Mercenaria mercenaria]
MGPKATPAKQKNTLFSYFAKGSTPKECDRSSGDVLAPKKSPNKTKLVSDSVSQKAYEVGDLLWCKLEGYPWWPSLICNHPTQNTHFKGGKNPQVHVQFFDNPVSRAWIKLKNCHEYKGSEDAQVQKGGMFHTNSAPVVKGAEAADEAMKLSREDRLGLVVELQPSDEEDEMDLDPEIFDDEMSDEDNSKENMDIGEEKVKKTPRKSPAKGRRSQRNRAKRRRIIVEDDEDSEAHDSGDEFKPDAEEGSDDDDDASSGVDEDDVSSDDASEPDSPMKLPQKRKRPAPKPAWGPKSARKSAPKSVQKALSGFSKDNSPDKSPPKGSSLKSEVASPKVSDVTKSKLAAFSASDSVGQNGDSAEDKIVYQHCKYEWLQPDKIKDGNKRLKTDEGYDPRTLYIPESEKSKFTPAMRQWWEIKSHHFDTVLFFKMGKFYELFHMDATIAVNELGLIYMKGDYAHSGFPEIAYGRYADTLVQRGYKVARIEQTETPDMMNERCKNLSKPSKFDKVVKREVCRITTKGTKTFSFLSGECADSQSTYLMAIAEKEMEADSCSTYGVCFVDTSIGKFHIGQFLDDRHSSRLRTLLAHYPPVQILYEKGHLSPRTLQVINNNLTSVMKEALTPKTEFWESSKTLRVLSEETYFKQEESSDVEWPEVLKAMMADSDALGRTASEEYSLAVSSLGALTWYLQYSLLDEELLSMKTFEKYEPLDNLKTADKSCKTSFDFGTKHMVLDGVSLSNLDVTENSSSGTLEGTLLERLDQCYTPFGKRLFRQWLCAPLCNPASINDRLDAVEDLIGCQDVVAEVVEKMKKLPDLERLLSRIHTLGTAKSKKHPDGRAILYEEVTYSKRKIEDFLATLDGFKVAAKIAQKFGNAVANFKAQLLSKTLGIEGKSEGGLFPDLADELKFFDHAFDHNKAKKDGVIVPSKGVDPDYDKATRDIESTQSSLQQYLDKQKTRLGCRSIVYWGTGKNRYQMEIPESAVRNVPNEFQLMSSKKGAKRFRTTDIEEMLAELVDAEERKDAALKDVMRRIFHNFDKRYKMWDTAVQCMSVLDVLLSMAQYSRCADGVVCRPEIVVPDDDQQPFLEIRDARHPCVCRTFTGGDFIPNDTVIGIKDENENDADDGHGNSQVVLVTGPNMGGKSTLMRQVGLVVIMAQMGCYVPAEKCRLTPVDRVFTRLGASDRIMAGESTFFVELSETSAILQHATRHSLVLVDELGRGTATYDGTAIACAVVQELSRNVTCRTLFSTHYHSLVEEFSHDPNIRLGHMACMVENEDEEDPTQETITFLYKFTSGACPKSYGFNAARLANLPEEVIKVAVQKAKEFESSVDTIRCFRNLWKDSTKEKLQAIQTPA